MSATVSPRSRIRANARAPSRRCSARRCSASCRTCACRSASHWLTALSFCSATRKATMSSRLSDSRFSRSRFTCAWASRTLRRTSCLDSIGAIVPNLRLPGSALTLAPPLSTTNIRVGTMPAPANQQSPRVPMLTFDVLSLAWAERARRRPSRCAVAGAPAPASPLQGRSVPRRKAAFANHRCQSSCRLWFSTPRFVSHPNIKMASPHSPHPLPPHLAHTPP